MNKQQPQSPCPTNAVTGKFPATFPRWVDQISPRLIAIIFSSEDFSVVETSLWIILSGEWDFTRRGRHEKGNSEFNRSYNRRKSLPLTIYTKKKFSTGWRGCQDFFNLSPHIKVIHSRKQCTAPYEHSPGVDFFPILPQPWVWPSNMVTSSTQVYQAYRECFGKIEYHERLEKLKLSPYTSVSKAKGRHDRNI